MSYILRKVGNATNIAVNQYEADTELDMKDINVHKAPMGSRCYVINTGTWYVLNDKGEWKVVPKKEGGGGGQGAALPEMGEVTKDMYLTNDGSNAEWEAIDIPQSDWEQTDESAADYVKNRPFGNFAHHTIGFSVNQGSAKLEGDSPGFNELLNTVGEKTARIEHYGDIICQGTAVTVLDEEYGNIKITFTSDDKLNELVFSGQNGYLHSLTINKSNITWSSWNIYSLFIDGLTYIQYQKLSRFSVEGTLPYTKMKDYIPVSSGNDSWDTRSIESINPIFQLSGASAGQIAKITAVDESGKPTEWEAVDMPSGGGVEWYEVIDTETTEAVNDLVISTDKNGRPISGYHALAMVLCFMIPADSTQTSDDGKIWVYPMPTNSPELRTIITVSAWKKTSRTYNYLYAGSNRAIFLSGENQARVFDGNYNDIFNGISLHVNEAGDHLPVGTKVRCLVLSKGWEA